MIGRTISHYEILEKIGEGGMGEVYLAEDLKLHRRVALKFLPLALTADPDRKERFLREARAAANLEHPHMAAIHEVDEVEGRTFIVMEYVRVESLRDAIRGEKLTLERSLELARQIADGLAFAHERGVVHRDLKPENVVISEQGYAKIIDLGIAKLLGAPSAEAETLLKTREGFVMGTPAYMSPEQARGGTVDARSDIFSFGIVLYEMISGQSPFQRQSLAETLGAILHTEVLPLKDARGDLDRVLRKALAKDPNDRYQSMRELLADLDRLRERAPRQRSALVAALLAAGVIVAAGSVLVRYRAREPAGIGAAGRPAIAVVTFQDHTADEGIRWLSRGLPDMMLTGLAQTPGLDVVSSQRIHEVLRQMGEEAVDPIDRGIVSEVARRAGAGAVVSGSIFKSGSEIRIDVQVEDLASGRVLAAQSVTGTDVFPLVDDLTGRVRDSMRLPNQPSVRGISEVTSSSLEAFRFFSEGMDAFRNLRYPDARRAFQEAVAIDPSFAMAYLYLSIMADQVGEPVARRDYLESAIAHKDRLPERQRALVEAEEAAGAGFLDRSVARLEELIDRYPDEESAYHMLTTIYYGLLDRPDQALATSARGVAAIPRAGGLRNLHGYQLMNAGRYDEAIREFETYAELNPREPNPFDSQGEAYLVIGEPEKALDRYATALEVDPKFANSHKGRAWAFATLGRYDEALAEDARYQSVLVEARLPRAESRFMTAFLLSRVGRYREARERIAEGMRAATSLGDRETQVGFGLLLASIELERRNFVAAIEKAEQAGQELSLLPREQIRIPPSVPSLVAGTAEARAGRLQAARARLGAEESAPRPSSFDRWIYHALEGEIALAASDFEAARAAFSTGEPEFKMTIILSMTAQSISSNHWVRDGFARARAAEGDLRGAIDEYRKLLTPSRTSKWTAMLEPLYVLELARLLEKAGDREAARREYERFLELWKNADSDLPELRVAREGLLR